MLKLLRYPLAAATISAFVCGPFSAAYSYMLALRPPAACEQNVIPPRPSQGTQRFGGVTLAGGRKIPRVAIDPAPSVPVDETDSAGNCRRGVAAQRTQPTMGGEMKRR